MKLLFLFFLIMAMFTGCSQDSEFNMHPDDSKESIAMEDVGEVDNKREVTIAVPVMDMNVDLESSISSELYEIITAYNEDSDHYQITPVAYTDETDLQLMIVSGEIDLINWGESVLQQSNGPNVQMYASKGYLLDLESSDVGNNLNLSDFIERIISLDKKAYGGLYTLPMTFYGRTLIGKTEYVGEVSGWTLSDVENVVSKLPSDMTLYSGVTQSVFLELMLDCIITDFADPSTKSVDFCNTEFYSLLAFCKDFFPREQSEEVESSEPLLYVTPLQGYAGIFGEGVLSVAEEQGICPIGYPLREGAVGNGVNLVFVNELSICTNSNNIDGAVDFLSYVFSGKVQESISMFSPIQSVFENNEKKYLTENKSCTQELSEAAMSYIYDASSIAMRKSPVAQIVLEEADAYFNGDKTVEEVATIIQSRVKIYLSEQY